jgi:Domain of unknown function (DUF4190)
VVGLLGIPLSCCCSFFSAIMGIMAIVLGVVAIQQINGSAGTQNGKGLAIGGVVAGAVQLVLVVLMMVLGFGSTAMQEYERRAHGTTQQ